MSKTVVVASGYFNPLHYGHISYLQKAKDCGTHLIVIVNNDRQAAMKMVETPGYAAHSMAARDRVRLVRSLACVDAAIEAVDADESVADSLRMLHPDVFANGGKTSASYKEAAVCQELGIDMVGGLGIEMLLLQPFTQHYEWGKRRGQSAVAYLTGEAESPMGASPGKSPPYAELWMGDHPSGPSQVKTPGGAVGDCLTTMLKRAPSVLGAKLSNNGVLPFLMKVLSIEKALSIQAHPDKELAAKLHSERPDVYKDANHKPEVAIALTDFEALCGFRPVVELLTFVDAVPELREVVGEQAAEALRAAVDDGGLGEESAALKLAYGSMMRTSQVVIDRLIPQLVERALSGGSGLFPTDGAEGTPSNLVKVYMLVTRLHHQFGEDIGIFSVFFLNYVEMAVGECLYMPQNTPHAYLSGDIVECMACSDNVVRGGLTPKFKDIDVLVEMLVYRGGVPPTIDPCVPEEGVKLYAHKDLSEFQVTHLRLVSGRTKRFTFSSLGPALGFCFRGTGHLKISEEVTKLKPGVVFLLAAGVDATITGVSDLDCFVACCPPSYFRPEPRRTSKSTVGSATPGAVTPPDGSPR